MDQGLFRLVQRGLIRRLTRGIYDYPKISTKMGPLKPFPQALARTLADRTNSQLQMTGADHAANALGLTTQVPARVVYLTSEKPSGFALAIKQ